MCRLCTLGVELKKRIQAAHANHFLGDKPLGKFHSDHLAQHLCPADDGIQEFGS